METDGCKLLDGGTGCSDPSQRTSQLVMPVNIHPEYPAGKMKKEGLIV